MVLSIGGVGAFVKSLLAMTYGEARLGLELSSARNSAQLRALLDMKSFTRPGALFNLELCLARELFPAQELYLLGALLGSKLYSTWKLYQAWCPASAMLAHCHVGCHINSHSPFTCH